MLKENRLNRIVPRAEYDYRAREARRRAEQLEQQLVRHDVARVARIFRVFRFLSLSVADGRKGDDGTGSRSAPRPCDIPMASSLGIA